MKRNSSPHLLVTLAMLVVCAWPGPVPLVHSHGDLDCSQGTLTEHLARFHSDEQIDRLPQSSSHFHWVFLFDLTAHEGVFPSVSENPVVPTVQSDSSELLSSSLVLDLTEELSWKPTQLAPVDVQHPQRLTDSLSVSKQTFLCVWNC